MKIGSSPRLDEDNDELNDEGLQSLDTQFINGL